MSKKIGFWSLFALVTGSQIGSGIFMLPANLAPYGWFGVFGWVVSGLGAIALALVFAKLSSWYPKTGGPHAYAQAAFGNAVAFWTGWTYWVISWVSTTAVVVASVSYLDPIFGPFTQAENLVWQLGLLFCITCLNWLGVYAAGRAEFFLTLLKLIPLVALPALALLYFNSGNIQTSEHVMSMPVSFQLSHVTLLTLWGFIGLESGTTPAESVDNPTKTIPLAIVSGTIAVALIYFINSLGVLGVVPSSELALSQAPYASATQYILGGQWHLLLSGIASILCIGTLNAWALTSGQIALGLAQDRLLPRFFGKTNQYNAPYVALSISALGIVPLLFLTADNSLARQIETVIDFSVTAFLFVYVVSCLAFFKTLKSKSDFSIFPRIYGTIGLIFCLWILSETSLQTLLTAALFTASGLLIIGFRP